MAGPTTSVINRITSTAEEKTALQFALYNTLLFVLVGLCLLGVFAVYQILYMFLTPILWATLIGTVLFPLKRKISGLLKGWLKRLDDDDRPLIVGIALLPLETFSRISERVYFTFMSRTGIFALIGYVVLKVLSYKRTFMVLLSWAGKLFCFIDALIGLITQNWVFPLFLLYFIAYATWIYVQDPKAIKKKFARSLSLPIWIFLLAHVSHWFGPFQVVMFAASAVTLGLISAGIVGADINEDDDPTEATEEEHAEVAEETSDTKPLVESTRPIVEPKERRLDNALSGDAHLQIIAGLSGLLWTVRHDSIFILTLIPFLYAILVRLGQRLGVTDAVAQGGEQAWAVIYEKSHRLVNIAVAGSLRKFVKLLFTSDRMFVTGLRKKVDLISSVVVMIILALGMLFFIIFTGFQMRNETAHLVKLGSNVISSNPDWLKFAMNYTEVQLQDHDIDEYMEKAYHQGRVWLASNARTLADPKDTARGEKLEQQAKLIVDNLYHLWEERNAHSYTNSTPASAKAVTALRGDWMTHILTTSSLSTLREELTEMVKENIETVISIAQSLWSILLMNISFLSSIVIALLSLVLSFGSDILHFFIEIVVFLTVVYYLLANSTDQWLPLRWVGDMTPLLQRASHDSKTDISKAIESSISGVFVLSAKMGIFYGLYTYFVHSLFDLNVVFVPSMFASVLAAIPIVPPYTVSIFGIVELYLMRGETAAAIVFALSNLAPLFFADAAFYSEIKGSHPYVTGLAIIGGIYWLGLQGAIIGPIILCCVLVLVNIYADFVKSE